MTREGFCGNCYAWVPTKVRIETEIWDMHGDKIETTSDIAYCTICGNKVWDSELDSLTLEQIYRKYCDKHGFANIQEMREYWRKQKEKVTQCQEGNI